MTSVIIFNNKANRHVGLQVDCAGIVAISDEKYQSKGISIARTRGTHCI